MPANKITAPAIQRPGEQVQMRAAPAPAALFVADQFSAIIQFALLMFQMFRPPEVAPP